MSDATSRSGVHCERRFGTGQPSRSCRSRSVAWFETAFPEGRRPAQALAWPAIAAGEHVLLVSPTGTGKTLAAFLAILDRLFRARRRGRSAPGLRCVYVSPLRSLNYDIERNLAEPLEGIAPPAGAGRPARSGSACGRATPRPTSAASCGTIRRTS